MYKTGHMGAGLILYAPLALLLALAGGPELALIGAIGVTGLTMLPDQDQRIPFIKHRGITHTVWFALFVGIIGGAGGVAVGIAGGVLAAVMFGLLGFLLGTLIIVSHIAADALTPMGVKPFAPVRNTKYTYSIAKAKNPIANFLLLVLGGIATSGGLVLGIAI